MILLTVSNVLAAYGVFSVLKLKSGRGSKRRRTSSGNMSEFATCLLVFFLFALFPLINLIFFAANCGTVAMITRNAAASAATSSTYGKALASAQLSVTTDLSGGFGKFSKLTANGGMNNSGVDLYVVATSLTGGSNQVYGPNVPPPSIDTNSFIYEYRASASFTLQPFVNMSSVPFIGSVPVVGAAVPFNYVSERAVEDVAGLAIAAPGGAVAAAAGGGPVGGPSLAPVAPPFHPGGGDSSSSTPPPGG